MGHLLFIIFLRDSLNENKICQQPSFTLLQPREAIAYIPGCLKSNFKSILFRAHDKISAILQKWSFSFCIICVCHTHTHTHTHSVDLFMGKWSSPLLVKSQQYGCNGSERQSSFTQFPYVQRLCLVNSPIHISGHPMLLWSCLRLVIFWRSYYHPLMYLEC
jgi:hypothetical protein